MPSWPPIFRLQGRAGGGQRGHHADLSDLVGPTLNGKKLEPYGVGYSRLMLQDVLRKKMGFKGIILSDWAITVDCNERCSNPTAEAPQRPQDISTAWGVNDLTVEQRYVLGVKAGIDQFGGTQDVAPLLSAVKKGLISQARLDQSVRRVLEAKFKQGLFDNPYVDPARAQALIATPANHVLAAQTQREAQVLLTNKGLLPVVPAGKKVWLFDVEAKAAQEAGLSVVATPAEADFVIIRAESPSEKLHPNHFSATARRKGTSISVMAMAPMMRSRRPRRRASLLSLPSSSIAPRSSPMWWTRPTR
jgi:beta-glucosidase